MKIIFIIGGARSGKSSFALKEALKVSGRKAYIATAQAFDDEMKERIHKHKLERDAEWDTFEEPEDIIGALSNLNGKYGAIILDCLTLWLSNVMHRAEGEEQRVIDELVSELHKFKNPSLVTCHSSLYIVSNEVGMGIVPENKLARQFRDLAGTLNQKIAEIADEGYLVTAGIPMKIKG